MTTAIANISTLDRPPATHPAVDHPIVSRDQWLAERRKLLAREKELTRLGDHESATLAYERALKLVGNAAERAFLTDRVSALRCRPTR